MTLSTKSEWILQRFKTLFYCFKSLQMLRERFTGWKRFRTRQRVQTFRKPLFWNSRTVFRAFWLSKSNRKRIQCTINYNLAGQTLQTNTRYLFLKKCSEQTPQSNSKPKFLSPENSKSVGRSLWHHLLHVISLAVFVDFWKIFNYKIKQQSF